MHRRRDGHRDDHRARLTQYRSALPIDAVAAGAPLDLELDETGAPGRPVVFVDLAGAGALPAEARTHAARRLGEALPVSVGLVGRDDVPQPLLDALSLSLGPDTAAVSQPRQVVPVASVSDAADQVDAAVRAAPRAAVTLGRLLRSTAVLPVADALAAESAAYSMLLAAPEFGAWLARRGAPRPSRPGRVTLARDGDVVTVTVDRPERRNAIDTATRDALVDALALLADPAVLVELRGRGPAFGAGGDLDEFGSAPDVGTAHLVRLEQSVGRLIARHQERVTAFVHGACYGAGCEIPAFAGRVVAAGDSRFALPELGLGLIPGAGGTVSVTRRIGRWRTAWMALTGEALEVARALSWGLADERVG